MQWRKIELNYGILNDPQMLWIKCY